MDSQRLTTFRGDTFTLNFEFTDDDTGDPIDITGWILFFTMKEKVSDTDANALIKKEVTVHSNPTGGISAVTLESTDTDEDEYVGNFFYDVQAKRPDTSIVTLCKGIIYFDSDVTRRVT